MCISLVLNKTPILGCISHPPTLDTWIGGKEIGTLKYCKDNTKKIYCRKIPNTGPVIAISRHHIGPKLKDWLSKINHHQTKKIGSALKFCFIAEGKADLFLELAKPMNGIVRLDKQLLKALEDRYYK